ncbi:hypothetical protein DUI87_30948 [Hirundo rustica rustica]|uniref:Peptidase A2 domain-containing protein n=1 Tax=Hirundo rustica rustica TaxID=333673 RepID=A0A3M0J1I1_HIRRU|nr:hypothetical protein DUI87_30948 [Hirundo rustica rustica]
MGRDHCECIVHRPTLEFDCRVADTGSNVTIVAHSKWPQGWELVPVNGVISGIGGATTSMWNKRAILTEGPDGQIAIDNPRTLRDLQQLCGNINWVRNLIGITTEDLVPLFNLLRGSDDLDSPQTITPDVQEVIQKVSEALSTKQAHHVDPALPSNSLFWPNQNIWVILAKALQQDNLCLSMGSVDNLLSMCLVGVPLAANEYPYTDNKPNPVDTWDEWTRPLPQAPEEPQELELLGSSKAYYCIQFNINLPMNS